MNYWYNGGREKKLGLTGAAKETAVEAKESVTEAVQKAKDEITKVGK